MSVWVNFVDICLQGMCDRSMRSGMDLALEFQLTDWSTTGNLSNSSSGVQMPHNIILFAFWALFVLCKVQLDNNHYDEYTGFPAF